jgi:hypothetical protein
VWNEFILRRETATAEIMPRIIIVLSSSTSVKPADFVPPVMNSKIRRGVSPFLGLTAYNY